MKSRTLLALLAAGIILSGCTKDGQDGKGNFRIVFAVDPAVNGVVVTRALEGFTVPEENEFSLAITTQGGDDVDQWPDITKYPGPGYYFDPGNYVATAVYGDKDAEGFVDPAFGVVKSFTILKDTTTPVEMTARMFNMAVTVEYTDLFKGYFPTRNVVITRGGTELADFSAQPEGSVAAFIKPEAFKAEVSFTHQDGVRKGSKIFDITKNIAACNHHKLILDVNEGAGGSLTVEASFNNQVETIPLGPIEVGDDE